MPEEPGRSQSKENAANNAKASRSPLSMVAMLLGFAGLLFLASLVFAHARTNQKSAVTPGSLASKMKPIDGISCDSGEHSGYHVHAHLTILVHGKPATVPAGVGIPSGCYYWLHTHDNTGTIHIEAPRNSQLTLGDFYDIWGKAIPISRSSIRAYVNLRPYLGNPREIVFRDHTDITLEVGPPFKSPRRFAFAADGV